jgi:hypothetical protein
MAYRWRIADFAVGQFLKAQAEIIAAPQTYVSSATLTIPNDGENILLAAKCSVYQKNLQRSWSSRCLCIRRSSG